MITAMAIGMLPCWSVVASSDDGTVRPRMRAVSTLMTIRFVPNAHVKAGELRALGVTTAARQAVLPDVPSISEFVPGYEASSWLGIVAPKATPVEIVDKLHSEINAALANPEMKKRLSEIGTEPMPMPPAEFGKFIVAETDKWGKVVKFAGIKVE